MIAMNNFLPRLPRLPVWEALCALALLPGAMAHAQEEKPKDRWFKVELMIFTQPSKTASRSENWNPSPVLEYPGESRFLVLPKSVAANLEAYDATGIVDEFGRQILTMNLPPLDEPDELLELDENGKPLYPALNPENIDPQDTVMEGDLDSAGEIAGASAQAPSPPTELPEPEESEPLPLKPTPFVALGAAAMEFNGKAAYMRRRGGYKILFHQSWVQPVAPQESALPVVIDRSGDTRQWPVLQGSIKLYLSRFLHLETNLWINTMGEYFPETWQIPPAPRGPQSLIVEYQVVLPDELPDELSRELPDELPGTTQAQVVSAGELEAAPLEAAPPVVVEHPWARVESDGDWEKVDSWEFDEPMAIDPVYPWRHAVVLQQTRKMRSTEVHYIDHPMLGVVALISPVTEEELDAIAQAEILAAQAAAALELEGANSPTTTTQLR